MELARKLRHNLHPRPSAHSPYGDSTLSPGSQGLPPDSSVMALFNASATNTRQLLPLLCPTLGLGVKSPQDLPSKTNFLYFMFSVQDSDFLIVPSPPPLPLHVFPVFQRRLLSPASLSHLSALPPLDPVSSSLQDDEGYSQVLRREEYTFSYIKNLAGRVRLRAGGSKETFPFILSGESFLSMKHCGTNQWTCGGCPR